MRLKRTSSSGFNTYQLYLVEVTGCDGHGKWCTSSKRFDVVSGVCSARYIILGEHCGIYKGLAYGSLSASTFPPLSNFCMGVTTKWTFFQTMPSRLVIYLMFSAYPGMFAGVQTGQEAASRRCEGNGKPAKGATGACHRYQ